MNEFEAMAKYKEVKRNKSLEYKEEIHCPMMFETVARTGRLNTFCEKSMVSKRTVYNWWRTKTALKECYDLAQIIARENWEREVEDNQDNEEWNYREWEKRGERIFGLTAAAKVILELDEKGNPWEHYQQIMKQASHGAFTATEIKLLMEALNVGTKVFETFKLQEEVDKMQEELKIMEQRNGNNIVTIAKTA